MRHERIADPTTRLLSGISLARRPTGPLLGILVVLVAFLVGQLIGAVLFVAIRSPAGEGIARGMLVLTMPEQLAFTGSFIFVVALLAAWLRFKEHRPFAGLGFAVGRSVGTRLLLGSAVALIAMTLPVVINLVTGQFTLRASPGGVTEILAVLIALLGFAVQGSTEEILTRGYLMQVFWRKWGLAVAIAAQAVIFAALHASNAGLSPVGLVNLVLIALSLAFWALAEGGLWGVCAFHSVWNWCQGNVYGIEVSGLDLRATLFSVSGEPGGSALLTGGRFGIEGSLLTTLVLAAVLAVAVMLFRRWRLRAA